MSAQNKKKQESDHPIEVNDLIALLKGFDQNELDSILDSLMALHRRRAPEDYKITQSHLEDHAKSIYEYIQGNRLKAARHTDGG